MYLPSCKRWVYIMPYIFIYSSSHWWVSGFFQELKEHQKLLRKIWMLAPCNKRIAWETFEYYFMLQKHIRSAKLMNCTLTSRDTFSLNSLSTYLLSFVCTYPRKFFLMVNAYLLFVKKRLWNNWWNKVSRDDKAEVTLRQ